MAKNHNIVLVSLVVHQPHYHFIHCILYNVVCAAFVQLLLFFFAFSILSILFIHVLYDVGGAKFVMWTVFVHNIFM